MLRVRWARISAHVLLGYLQVITNLYIILIPTFLSVRISQRCYGYNNFHLSLVS